MAVGWAQEYPEECTDLRCPTRAGEEPRAALIIPKEARVSSCSMLGKNRAEENARRESRAEHVRRPRLAYPSRAASPSERSDQTALTSPAWMDALLRVHPKTGAKAA